MEKPADIEKLKYNAAQDADSPLRQNQLGNAYFKEGKFKEARQCYLNAVELNPNVPVYYENIGLASDELGDWQSSVEAYEKAAALSPSWSIHNSLGIAYYKLNDHKHAIENYLSAIELDPKQAIFYDNLGLAYDQLSKLNESEKADNEKKAENAFLKATELDPDNYTFHNRLGVFYSLHGSYGKAIEHFKKAIQFGKGEAVLFENIGLA